jgi:hypothetical protein
MSNGIGYLAWRIVEGVGAQPGEVIVVMDHAGRDDLLRAILLAIETAGATTNTATCYHEYCGRTTATTWAKYSSAS